jgi:hypothetical protein
MMGWPSDWLTGLFLFLFAFGLIFSVVSLLLGVGDDLPGLDLDGDPNTHGHSSGPSPLSLSTIMIFLTWFGAAGYIARTWGGLAAGIAIPLATVAGIAGGAIVWLFLAKVLWRGQSQLDPEKYDVTGTPATVTSAIRAGGTGEIVYTLDGKRRVDGARTVDGSPLPDGAEVTIVRYRAGIAYVAPLAWAESAFVGDPVEPMSLPPPK